LSFVVWIEKRTERWLGVIQVFEFRRVEQIFSNSCPSSLSHWIKEIKRQCPIKV